MNGVMNASVSLGSSQRAASVTCTPQVRVPEGASAAEAGPASQRKSRRARIATKGTRAAGERMPIAMVKEPPLSSPGVYNLSHRPPRDAAGDKEEIVMARIKHIALTTANPDKVAAFYTAAFGLKEIRRSSSGAVFLTDGHINLAILNHKTEKDADVGANGPNYNGIHHFGFEVDDLDEACEKLDAAQG